MVRGPRPSWLPLLSGLELLLVLVTPLVATAPQGMPPVFYYSTYVVLGLLWLLALYFLWSGHNWARIVVIIGAGVAGLLRCVHQAAAGTNRDRFQYRGFGGVAVVFDAA